MRMKSTFHFLSGHDARMVNQCVEGNHPALGVLVAIPFMMPINIHK